MRLYAACDEYGNVWTKTISENKARAQLEALEMCRKDKLEDCGGLGILSWTMFYDDIKHEGGCDTGVINLIKKHRTQQAGEGDGSE